MEEGFSWSTEVEQVPVYGSYIRERGYKDQAIGPYLNRLNAVTTLTIFKSLSKEELHHCFGRDVVIENLKIIEDRVFDKNGKPLMTFKLV